MLCLVCDAERAILESKNEVVDYCEHCQDIWLARDEIDRLLDGNFLGSQKLRDEKKPKKKSDGASHSKGCDRYRQEGDPKAKLT